MVKRIFDLCVSILAISLLWPVLLSVAILVRANLGSPILFVQQRPGLNRVPFNMFKFRTMTDEMDVAGNTQSDADRLTRFGRFLRSASLDELPSLWNVLVGDMSLVGPRPLLMQYLSLYNERQALRHDVRPGITGWAQINGRNGISWEEKFERDVWYIENQSIILDVKIITLTFLRVLRRQDINAAGEATIHAFEGSQVHSITEISDLNRSRK
jgi:lipopolysaccharide/colanic/teichoic acid biosynthesis glycosyltransferase